MSFRYSELPTGIEQFCERSNTRLSRYFSILTVYLICAFASHFAFYLEDAAGFTCKPSANSKPLPTSQRSSELTFQAATKCWASGVIVKKGVRYVISLKISDGWADGDYQA